MSAPITPTSVAALPDNVPMDIYQGDDLYFVVTVIGLDLTGATGLAQIRRYPSSTVHVDMGVVIVGSDTVQVSLSAAASAVLQPGANVWDLQVLVNGRIRTLATGVATVHAQVTM